MRIVLFIGVLAAAFLAAVAALNWQAIAAPVPFNIGASTVQAPTGLILLSLAVTVIVALVIYLVGQASTIARTNHAHAKAMEAQRTLAERAEASRFSELRAALASEFERFSATLASTQDALRVEIQDSGNSIAAMLAEIDDRATPRRFSVTGDS